MIPQASQHVKCILRNGAIAEGIVEEWTDSNVQLKSLDDESVLIITHPSEDIVLIKIILKPIKENASFQMVDKGTHMETPDGRYAITWPHQTQQRWEDEEKANYGLNEMRKEFRARLYGPEVEFKEAAEAHDSTNPDDRKSLSQLKIELAEQEKKIIADKLKDHCSTKLGKLPNYVLPNIPEKSRSVYQPGRIPNGRNSKKSST